MFPLKFTKIQTHYGHWYLKMNLPEWCPVLNFLFPCWSGWRVKKSVDPAFPLHTPQEAIPLPHPSCCGCPLGLTLSGSSPQMACALLLRMVSHPSECLMGTIFCYFRVSFQNQFRDLLPTPSHHNTLCCGYWFNYWLLIV